MPEQITLYSNKASPWGQRVELALKEGKLDFAEFEVNMQNKPQWYISKVNPAGKVPAISYGGPKTSASDPNPASAKIAGSLVILEFIADIRPHLLPADAISRAKARFFIETASTKFIAKYFVYIRTGNDPLAILEGVEALQDLLQEGKGPGYAVGEWSIADAAVTPFVVGVDAALKTDLGEGEGKKVYEILMTDSKYERYRKYFEKLKKRESYKETFDHEYIMDIYSRRADELRVKKAASAGKA